ncbi:MAG: hypothetical protein KJ607_07035, partial [Bacteroidetes bacterium]|nr:hypothetical protein [Bacteroidota bacterium]
MKGLLISFCTFVFTGILQAQNVAITDDAGYSANSSAMLDVKSTTKGMLVPRVTTAQRNTISGPAAGLLVFDTTHDSFYFYTGTQWVNLTYGNTSDLWTRTGARVFLNDTTWRVGVGTDNPTGKLEVKGNASAGIDDPIFGVINSNGDTVFAVYPEGVRVYVADEPAKATGNKAGFAVGGYSLSKGVTNEYLRVTPDSVRIYVSEGLDEKAGVSTGGFAVGGFSLSKGALTNEYLRVTDDSVRIYIDENGGSKSSGSTGGFAVGGFSLSKSIPDDYFNISGADSAEIIEPSEARMVWYPTKKAFLSGQVLIEDVDSVGVNSMATGYESKAIGNYSQAFGFHARAKGLNSTAIGNYANAEGYNSFALGDSAFAMAQGSYAFGSVGRDELGNSTGQPTLATGDHSIAFGLGAQADAIGAIAIGNESSASNLYSTALGYKSQALASYSIALGYECTTSNNAAIAAGYQSQALAYNAVAIGENCYASGQRSTALGSNTFATSTYATAMGTLTEATGYASTATGLENYATGAHSFAMGSNTLASGDDALSTGQLTRATGLLSISAGYETEANGNFSLAWGRGIKANGQYCVAYALNNCAGTTVADSNVLIIMG